MSRQLFDHVIEESDSGRNVVNPRSVEVEVNLDRRFMGLSTDPAGAHDARYNDPVPVRNVLTAKRHKFTRCA